MSYETAAAGLKRLLRQELFSIHPLEHRHQIRTESDRVCIILNAAVLETYLVSKLKALMPSLNTDEVDRLFGFEGPCGSFSSRIRMSQALGIIDRPTRRKLDLIRELRNVAAHAHPVIGFDTGEIRDAVLALFPENNRGAIRQLPPYGIRRCFDYACNSVSDALHDRETTETLQERLKLIDEDLADA